MHMPFHVVCLETNAPVYDATGALPMIFAEGKQAAAAARDYSNQTGKKYQPRPITSDEWRQREQARFDAGTYQPLPWANADWYRDSIGAKEHYAHVSTERDGMVAFTESPEKGAADRQTRMRPGTYLQRFYSDKLSADEIQALARDYAGRFEDNVLLLATSEDEIERVYTTGPRSCMSARASDYSSPFHPVRVYAAGDLAVAYVMRGGNIVGRALCWPKEKKYSRVYGDGDRLLPLLTEAGYRHGRLHGAKLLRKTYDGGFVCPYIDEIYRVSDHGTFLCIGGDIPADSTKGLIDHDEGEYCPHCDERRDPDSFYYIEDLQESWCESCADNDSHLCDATGQRFGRDRNVVTLADGTAWSRDHFEAHGFTCDATGENYHQDEAVHMDGQVWCQDHFDRHGFQCHSCGDNFANEDGQEHDGDWYCEDCAPEPDEPEAVEPAALGSKPRKHIARQGRDMLPGQMEMYFPFHHGQIMPGDIVAVSSNETGARVVRWRASQSRREYPRWANGELFTVVNIFPDALDGAGTIQIHGGSRIETWESAAFTFIRRGN
jgi:hypothetical protein